MDGRWAVPGICHKLHTEDFGLHPEVVGYHQTFFFFFFFGRGCATQLAGS